VCPLFFQIRKCKSADEVVEIEELHGAVTSHGGVSVLVSSYFQNQDGGFSVPLRLLFQVTAFFDPTNLIIRVSRRAASSERIPSTKPAALLAAGYGQ
jgi:hypothetical protein